MEAEGSGVELPTLRIEGVAPGQLRGILSEITTAIKDRVQTLRVASAQRRSLRLV